MAIFKSSEWASSRILGGLFGVMVVGIPLAIALEWSIAVRASIIAVICLVLWLTEWVPVWFPTLLLWISVPIAFFDFWPRFQPWSVLTWSADPVLVLFFGGFSLAVAAKRCRMDTWLVTKAIGFSGGEPYRLITLVALTTLGLSMWMSNVAAAALVLGALRPLIGATSTPVRLRRALLLTVALAANIGGIATPVGSGPNGIALAAIEPSHPITFVHWMAFGTPLAIGLVLFILFYIRRRFSAIPWSPITTNKTGPITKPAKILMVIAAGTIALWLTEPVHTVPAWCIALGATVALVACGVLEVRDFRDIDWKTLMLIAGGIGLGALLTRSGVMAFLTTQGPLHTLPHTLAILGLCLLSACLSALMSNTGTVASLVPLAMAIDPSPSTAVLVAISASLGVPFVVSTPPNAMAVANGLQATDLLVPGLVLMVGGCILVALTGPWVLQIVGIP